MQAQPFFDNADEYNKGLTWRQYIEQNRRSPELELRRYHDVPASTLAAAGSIDRSGRALLLTQRGCIDGSWALPRIARILDATPNFDCRIFFRERRPDLQDRLLTDGKRAIPKLALLDHGFRLAGEWGPRPAPIQRFVNEVAGKLDRSEWLPEVLAYYRTRGGADLDRELLSLLRAR
ncbi:MAG: hypothetical protein MAG453_01386 [Calditrichaeota bacterium]|nr:hypothetical protein [Calditrichota bacterium]